MKTRQDVWNDVKALLNEFFGPDSKSSAIERVATLFDFAQVKCYCRVRDFCFLKTSSFALFCITGLSL